MSILKSSKNQTNIKSKNNPNNFDNKFKKANMYSNEKSHNNINKNPLGIYIHIPFCIKKCHYCNFFSIECKEKKTIDNYIASLLKEIEKLEIIKQRKEDVCSIYFGGGTPSILKSSQLKKILDKLFSFNINKNIEITIEVNPETIEPKNIKEYLDVGINRISLGAQSFDDKKLKELGRIHNKNKTISLLKELNKLKVNTSIDLIFGLLGDTLESVMLDVKTALKFNVDHVSLYSLEIEKGNKKLKEVEDILNRKIYRNAVSFLKKNNIFQYEISNFSKKGRESIHNLNYFNFNEYIGIGSGAHSFYMEGNKFFRRYNEPIRTDNKAIKNKEIIIPQSKNDNIKDFIIFSLRKNEGLNLKKFNELFNKDFLEEYKEQNEKNVKNRFIKITAKNVLLTKKGFDFYNTCVSEYM